MAIGIEQLFWGTAGLVLGFRFSVALHRGSAVQRFSILALVLNFREHLLRARWTDRERRVSKHTQAYLVGDFRG